MLLEAMLEGVAKPTSSISKSEKEYIYAPECESGAIKTGMMFTVDGNVWKATSDTWSCPASWNSAFADMGDVDNFITTWPESGSFLLLDENEPIIINEEIKSSDEESKSINANLIENIAKKSVRHLRG